jgi:uroporphyrin-III C-methyltransferase/precorrin-2 dehydrogenase/sirohydrochlorin ferrochelatase
MDQFLPSIPLKGARVLVVGSGPMAQNKLRLFRDAPCELVWWPLDGADISAGDLGGFKLVFIAVKDHRLAADLAGRARRAGALVNVVDNRSLCDFYTPAIVDRGSVTIAISTGGAAPVLARDLRSAIENIIPAGLDQLAKGADVLRETVRKVLPDVETRRRFWETTLRGPIAVLSGQAQEADIRRSLLKALDTFGKGEPPQGTVYLIGAGPGDPELLTVKAARLLRDADVVVHDRLVSPEVLDRARRDALRIDVGKTPGSHPTPQERISEILIEQARAGRKVVRLKGGDSFVFGRGGEEVEAVRAAGIEVHVIPGISAGLACAAFAQIPLTHRDTAQAVTFLTGQSKLDGPDADYNALAAANHTLVIYMGIHSAARTVKALISAGRNPNTPIAIVENGSLPQERLVTGFLADIPSLIERENIKGPAVIIIGEVARAAQTRASEIADLAQYAQHGERNAA